MSAVLAAPHGPETRDLVETCGSPEPWFSGCTGLLRLPGGPHAMCSSIAFAKRIHAPSPITRECAGEGRACVRVTSHPVTRTTVVIGRGGGLRRAVAAPTCCLVHHTRPCKTPGSPRQSQSAGALLPIVALTSNTEHRALMRTGVRWCAGFTGGVFPPLLSSVLVGAGVRAWDPRALDPAGAQPEIVCVY